jgi:hypothetical protein
LIPSLDHVGGQINCNKRQPRVAKECLARDAKQAQCDGYGWRTEINPLIFVGDQRSRTTRWGRLTRLSTQAGGTIPLQYQKLSKAFIQKLSCKSLKS